MKFKVGLHIFGGEKQLDVIKRTTLDYACFNEFDIKIFCPDADCNIVRNELKNTDVQVIPDSILDMGFSYKKKLIKTLKGHEKLEKLGWYFQQYLKIRSVEESLLEFVVILDGDTYVKPNYLVDTIRRKELSTTSEKVEKYNALLAEVFTMNLQSNQSFITNYGVIRRDLLIKKTGLVSDYYISVVRQVLQSNNKLDFSEYQLFANIMLGEGWIVRKFKFFRRADLLCSMLPISALYVILKYRGYDAYAFEFGHKRSFLKTCAAFVYVVFGMKW